MFPARTFVLYEQKGPRGPKFLLPIADFMVISVMEKEIYPAEGFPNQVRRTLEDLAMIRQSLLAGPDQNLDRKKQGGLLLDLELAAELKSVVDALRQLLWAYIQTLSAQSGRKPAEILEWYKMEIAVEMLRALRSREPVVDDEDASCTFEQLVNSALAISSSHTGKDRHC